MADRSSQLTAQAQLRQLDSLIRPWTRQARLKRPESGWIVAIREALGMTQRDFARRARTNPTLIRRIEEGEAKQTITLQTLARAANALECDLVYALVPRAGTLRGTLESRARMIAQDETGAVADTMALEAQGPTADELAAQRRDVEAELLRGSWSRLWRPIRREADTK